jgi:hypothetical protein
MHVHLDVSRKERGDRTRNPSSKYDVDFSRCVIDMYTFTFLFSQFTKVECLPNKQSVATIQGTMAPSMASAFFQLPFHTKI